jgi:heme/copper-type cytochrome/quinol oxidase subunit 2
MKAVIAVPVLALIAIVMVVPIPTLSEPQTHHFTIDSQQYEYDPGRIEVNQDDRVIIDITASDVVHGFYLDGYGIHERVEPGISKRIEFIADKPGKFRYRCSVSCGPMHPFMIGELVVGPNTTLYRAVASMLIGIAGTLLYLWKFKGAQDESTQIHTQK